jgi:hypothetical protein
LEFRRISFFFNNWFRYERSRVIYLELISFDVADRFVYVFSSLLPFDTYEEQIRTERVKRQKYWKAINDPDFCEKLKRGNLESMDTKSLVDLLKNMSHHIQSCSL